ncbi:hypothetical protein EGW08_002808 [Elysia chlorotica]|uniref:Antistasin-like domain-containing protein n=1 Tax=Elysia chlorotica TaxID=188477 RepID=A0A3S1CD37_ELYCH|nr:hypothetical protein EGW08_002808 [Elysia chlorotica]
MDPRTVCFAVLLLASLAYAQPKIPDPYEVHCMIACPPGKFLLWKECRCVSIDDYTPKPPPSYSTTTTGTITGPPTTCRPLRCPLRYIFPCAEQEVDNDGCPTCRCKCMKVTSRQCPTDCKYGTEWTKDQEGCKICACAPPPAPVPVKPCPPVCAIYCPYGNVLDSDGCPTCSCNSGDLQPW